jgi:hypothetical protein
LNLRFVARRLGESHEFKQCLNTAIIELTGSKSKSIHGFTYKMIQRKPDISMPKARLKGMWGTKSTT